MKPMTNRLPTGPGSRGGTYHLDKAAYDRAWRASHPEYRERERLRKARQRAREDGMDPADTVSLVVFPRPLPLPAAFCSTPACNEPVVTVCGFCRESLEPTGS